MPGLRVAFALVLMLAAASARGSAQQVATSSSTRFAFTIFVRGVPIGTEQIAVERTASGWTITSSGSTRAPFDAVARLVQAHYTEDWKPLDLSIDGTLQGLPLTYQTK